MQTHLFQFGWNTHYFSTKVERYLPCTQRTYGSPAFPGGHLHTGLPRSLLHSAPSPHGLFTEQGSARQPALFLKLKNKQWYRKHYIILSSLFTKSILHLPAVWVSSESSEATAKRSLSTRCAISVSSACIVSARIEPLSNIHVSIIVTFHIEI